MRTPSEGKASGTGIVLPGEASAGGQHDRGGVGQPYLFIGIGLMDIVGLGTHVMDCPRVRKLIDQHAEKFIDEVYTPEEAAYCRARSHSTEFYASIWAAKEAVFRSLGMKWKRGVDWRDVMIECESAIEPKVTIRGATEERMKARGVTRVLVSFSYSRMFATATAIAIRG